MNDGTPVDLARKWYKQLNFPERYDREFYALAAQYEELKPVPFGEGVLSRDPQDGGSNLILCLYFCQELEAQYIRRQIPIQILLDTMQDIVLWTNIHFALYGQLGMSEVNWFSLHFRFQIFTLGRLQFAIHDCRRDIPEIGVKKGDAVLDVHIPRGKALTQESCKESFGLAKEFFAQYFPAYDYRCFTCHSWLLDDTLAQFVKPQSNIMAFQKMFKVVEKTPCYDVIRFTVNWLAKPENFAKLTPTNGFTQRVLQYAMAGGRFYNGFGYIPKEDTAGNGT